MISLRGAATESVGEPRGGNQRLVLRPGSQPFSPVEQALADAALDAGIAVCRRYRRIAGDARKRNPILAFIYKGA